MVVVICRIGRKTPLDRSSESKHFYSNYFDEVNKFKEDNHRYFYPSENPDDYRFDVGNEYKLVSITHLVS